MRITKEFKTSVKQSTWSASKRHLCLQDKRQAVSTSHSIFTEAVKMNQFNLLAVQSSTCQKKPGSYRHAILSYYVLGNFSMFCKASVTKANWLMSNKHHAISPKEKK